MAIKTFDDIVKLSESKGKKKIAVAAAEDKHVLEAVKEACLLGIIEPILVGNKAEIETIAKSIDFNLQAVEIIDEKDPKESCRKAVAQVREGNAVVLMKGLVATGTLLKAVLDKENGLRKQAVLSHVAFFESPYYHKLLSVTDAAMNVEPSLEEKVALINNAVEAYHNLGIEKPNVGIVAPVETVNPKMESTLHAAILSQMNKRNQITGCEVDGPLALDNIVSEEAAKHKGIDSKVAGKVDIVLTPDINAGNVLYKALNFLGGAVSAAVIMGAKAPIVLTSRSDSKKSKLMSIALATAMK